MTVDEREQKLLYSTEETARLLSISTKTLREFVRAGDIAYVPLGRGKSKPRLGFHMDDINDFIRGRRTRETSVVANTRPARLTRTGTPMEAEIGFMARHKLLLAEKQSKKNKT